jgi:hypothetical protein
LDSVGAEDAGGFFDTGGDGFGGFDGVGLDVDDAEADGEVSAEVFEVFEFGVAAVGEFEDDVVGVEGA